MGQHFQTLLAVLGAFAICGILSSLPSSYALIPRNFDYLNDNHLTVLTGNTKVCGDQLCSPGEWQKLQMHISTAQQGNRTAYNFVENEIRGDMFDKPGNILISDQFNNRVIEVNPITRDIVLSFGSGNPSLCNPGPGAVIGTNDAERLADGLTLVTGTGLPANVSSSMPQGCADNRVLVVNQEGHIVWQYGQAGVTGSGPNLLDAPVYAIELPNHDFLITDQGNNRVIEVNKEKQIVWSYGPTSGDGALDSPNSAELLPNGHILIADQSNNRAIEITRDGNIVWQYDMGLQGVAFASRLPNGNTLIVDSGHSRILEIGVQNQTVFQYFTNSTSKSNPSPLPSNAVRLANNDTIIADQANNRVMIINSKGDLIFQYGMTNVIGAGPNKLNWPYTASVIGDYTGQTSPPSSY